ncbi:MAG: hypothetical protein KAW93_05710 [Methanogenium sp.]|nr:hypothetical protein [Methanogenium sp.]
MRQYTGSAPQSIICQMPDLKSNLAPMVFLSAVRISTTTKNITGIIMRIIVDEGQNLM